MLISRWRDVLVPPDTHGTTPLNVAWAMGGRVLDLPREFQDRALQDLQALDKWPDALTRAWRQLNPSADGR